MLTHHRFLIVLVAGFLPALIYAAPPSRAHAQVKPAATQPINVDVQKLADAVQKQYNSTNSATFDFEQAYQHPFMAVIENSKGKVSYEKNSGKMLWNYLEPKDKQKLFLLVGKKLTYYSVQDKLVYTHDCYDKGTLSASVAFLLGKGNLKQSFTVSPYEGELPNKNLSWLSLTPKEKDAPVKKISLGVGALAKVVESIVEDPSGGKNHFKFSNFKVNPKIAASVFNFTPPKGVIVQPMPNVTCPAAPVPATPKNPSPPKPLPAKINPPKK